MADTVVFYHHNCPDGFSAAWVIWKKLKDKAEYKWWAYHTSFNFDFKNKTIYFVDVSPTKEMIKHLMEHNEVIIIDHHVSAKQIMKIASDYSFSVNHCAAVLTWHYFFPKKPLPHFLSYIEDLDLWRFKHSHSKEINAAIGLVDFDFKLWDKMARSLETSKGRKEYIQKGKTIVAYQDQLIGRIASRAQQVMFEGYEALAVNSSVLVSEVGNALLEHHCSLAIIWFEGKNKKNISLRSKETVNAAHLAEKYGGGGHKTAAGFVLDLKESFPWKNI